MRKMSQRQAAPQPRAGAICQPSSGGASRRRLPVVRSAQRAPGRLIWPVSEKQALQVGLQISSPVHLCLDQTPSEE